MPDNNELDLFRAMQESGNFEVTPCAIAYDLQDSSKFKKAQLTPAQKMQFSAFTQQLPTLAAANSMANTANAFSGLYTVSFPDGLPHTLMQLKQGGLSTVIKNSETGRILGTASLYEVNTQDTLLKQAAVMNAFAVMSLATSQYYLTQINSQLDKMQLKIDRILAFLYGDKKAELLAELNFSNYACKCFSSVNQYPEQRTATIISLQAGRKVAMKDIEFYLTDLNNAVHQKISSVSDLISCSDTALNLRESIALSMQLYMMNSILELYYAQNYDALYSQLIEDNICAFISRCENAMQTDFSYLKGRIAEYKATPVEKFDKNLMDKKSRIKGKLSKLLDNLNGKEEAFMQKALHNALQTPHQKTTLYLDASGDIYLKR